MSRFALFSTAALALGLAAPAAGQTASLRSNGEATVQAKPDQVHIEIGVSAKADTAEAAAQQNAQQLNAVLEKVRPELGEDGQLQTTNVSLFPESRFDPERRTQEPDGFRATNMVRVTLNDISRLGSILGLATESGANQIHGIRFTVQDPEPLQAEALKQAAQEARTKAEALAQALGVRIVRIAEIEEVTPSDVRPVRMEMAAMRADASQAPIEAGTVEVSAQVRITFQVMQ